MAAGTSKWTTMGTNTEGVDDATNLALANPSEGLLSTRPRHECHMWLDDTSAIYTKDFNFPVNGDLTITFNATKLALAGTIGTCTAQVMGSVDGTNYVELKALGTTSFDTAVVTYVYDYDAEGRMPHMALAVTPNNGDDRSATPVKIVVTPH